MFFSTHLIACTISVVPVVEYNQDLEVHQLHSMPAMIQAL